jgi:hypothetical protein
LDGAPGITNQATEADSTLLDPIEEEALKSRS